MKIIQEGEEWIVLDWNMTPQGWLYSGVQWFNNYQDAWNYVYGDKQQ